MSGKKRFSKNEVLDLINEVEMEFGDILAKSAEASEEIEEVVEEKKEEKKDEKKEEKKDEEKKDEDKSLEKCGDMEKSEKSYEQELKELYGSMTKSEIEAHANVINSFVPAPMNKSEDDLLKSELAKKDEEIATLKKSLEVALDGVGKIIKKIVPAGKAITEMSYMAKSEEGKTEEKALSVKEIESTLLRKSQDASTTAAEREAINDYYLNGRNIETIKHLLTK